MSLRRTRLAVLSATSLVACADDTTVDPTHVRGYFEVYVSRDAWDGLEAAKVDATGDAQVEAGRGDDDEDRRVTAASAVIKPGVVSLPEPPEDSTFDVNGAEARNMVTDASDPHRVWLIDTQLEPSRLPASGDPFEITLELPGAPPVTKLIPMVQYTDIIVPTVGTEISRREDVGVAWSSAAPGETDWVLLKVVGASPASRHGLPAPGFSSGSTTDAPRAPDGVNHVTLRGDDIGEIYDEFMASSDREEAGIAPGSRVYADIHLFRTRTISNRPEFLDGETRLLVEVSRVRVVIAP